MLQSLNFWFFYNFGANFGRKLSSYVFEVFNFDLIFAVKTVQNIYIYMCISKYNFIYFIDGNTL